MSVVLQQDCPAAFVGEITFHPVSATITLLGRRVQSKHAKTSEHVRITLTDLSSTEHLGCVYKRRYTIQARGREQLMFRSAHLHPLCPTIIYFL